MKKLILPLALLAVVAIFFYFRVTPIINQTFPYTYDQGRDFLKAQSIVRDFDLTLLGPTTGISGIFHGAWWYYFLSVPYILFGGAPQGFVAFIMLTNFLAVLLFALFLKKNFSSLAALIFLILIAGSSYFIMMSSFAINGVLGFPFILLFAYSTYQFFKTKKPLFAFLIFFSLGNIFEAEVPFGLFTIPAYLWAVIVAGQLKNFFIKRENIFYSLAGLILPFLPRIASEAKNNFLQTRTAINFLLHPSYRNEKTIFQALAERYDLFKSYYAGLMPTDNKIFLVGFFLLALVGLILGYRKLNKSGQTFFKTVGLTVVFLFLLSLIYRDNFWFNYFEGISLYFALLLALFLSLFSKVKNKILATIPLGIFIILLIINVVKIQKDVTTKKIIPDTGLRGHIKVVDYLTKLNKGEDFCVRVYTPPVIPYTYNYIFSYYMKTGKIKNVGPDYVASRCFYIFEKDDYQFRVDQFRKDHVPAGARLINSHLVTDNVHIELWEMKSE